MRVVVRAAAGPVCETYQHGLEVDLQLLTGGKALAGVHSPGHTPLGLPMVDHQVLGGTAV